MRSIRTVMLGAAALVCLAGGAQAFTHHPSTPKERAQTKALNDQQLNWRKRRILASPSIPVRRPATHPPAWLQIRRPPPRRSLQ